MEDIYERKNRIEEALNIRRMKQVELSEKTGISKGALNNWVKQRWQPRQTPLMKMAQVLDVSEMWLAGYDVPMERPIRQKKMDTLSEIIQLLKNNERYLDLASKIRSLNDDQIILIENMVNQLIKIKEGE